MAKQRTLEINNYYHIYSRGVNKCKTFISHQDYLRFQKYITMCNTKNKVNLSLTNKGSAEKDPLVNIISYCLMPNHFHFILKEKVQGGTSLFMQKILSGYSVYFNKKYNRTGALFGARFKDKLIHNDIYFKNLLIYILYNPIKLYNPKYTYKAFLKGEININQEEINFAQDYPYKKFGQTEFGQTA